MMLLRSVRLGLAARLHHSKPRLKIICFSNQIFEIKVKVGPFLSSHFENKKTNANIYFNYQECELFKVPHCPEMIEHSCANESENSDAPHLTPQLSRLGSLQPGKALGQSASEEESEESGGLDWVGVCRGVCKTKCQEYWQLRGVLKWQINRSHGQN